ncbi:hypothetical protein PG614_03735 [Riemerella anatipestifer]|nr:hypothetical protein [Riemerella anatipestifer]MDY3532393.1 hypothetical protein [Riemerella anatipestifer]MDY3535052.1 hypothetical protein [Riemerella anatipestifer]
MKFDNDKYNVYEIISHGKFSNPSIGESRFIPFITIHKNALEVVELIDIHTETPPGDIETTWTRKMSIFKPKELTLKLKFTNPQEITFGINFKIDKHQDLIDGILISQALYLDTGDFGDKFMNTKSNKILIEVPRTSFGKVWDSIQLEHIKRLLKKNGTPKKEIKRTAEEFIQTNREIWYWRGK